jgi:glycosyltransferase involved in cell wall biosynthesis
MTQHWDFLLVITSVLLLGYLRWWLGFLIPYIRWEKSSISILHPSEKQGVSVIIPFRNEAHRIKPLLQSLLATQADVESNVVLEFLFCDDNSTDDTQEVIQRTLIHSSLSFTILNLPDATTGKKAALTLGIEKAKYSHIFTTDADCALHPRCISTLLAKMEYSKASMVLGHVSYTSDLSNYTAQTGNPVSQPKAQPLNGLLVVYQCIENTVLSAIGMVESQKNNAAVANGANLLFLKSSFLAVGGYQGHEHIASGDDVFTLEKFLLDPLQKVIHAEHAHATVFTQYEHSLDDFFFQRMRWMKKTFLQKTQKTALKQVLVGLFMFSLWVITIIAVYKGTYETLAIAWLGKLLVDSAGVHILCRSEKPNPLSVALVSLLQVIWLPMLAITAVFTPYRWKERRYRV